MTFSDIEFRSALGNFATGITVITAKDFGDDGYVGITANSFNSVSINPPLVLWSCAKSVRSLPVYEAAEYYAVNILASDQIEVSNNFATQQPDKFASVDFAPGIGGVPLLQGCAAVFQCKQKMMYEGGDHIIFVGEVLEFECFEKPPLVFAKGTYALSQPHPALQARTSDEKIDTFVDNYCHYLLLMAAQKFENSFIPIINDAGLNSHYEWRVLAMLNDRNNQTADELAERTPAKYAFVLEVLKGMVDTGLVREFQTNDLDHYALTDNGRQKAGQLLIAARTHESDALKNAGLPEADLKQSLKQLIGSLSDSVTEASSGDLAEQARLS